MTREKLLKNAKPILFNTEMVRAILEDRKTVTRRVLKPRLRDDEYGCHIWFNKTLNRHIVEKYDEDESDFTPTRYVNQPYEVGDILYVRETYRDVIVGSVDYDGEAMWTDDVIEYKASQEEFEKKYEGLIGEYSKWHPSIHMPKEATRIFLKVTGVRVERLQDISEVQSISEGVTKLFDYMSKSEFEDWSKRTSQNKIQSEYGYRNYLWHGNFGNYGLGNKLSDAWDYQFSCYRNPIDSFSSLWNSTIALNDWDKYGWEANPYVWVIELEKENYE